MPWNVREHPEFAQERQELPESVSDKLDAILLAIEQTGPNLGRPQVDTLNGSRHKNMKEIRFGQEGGAWRFAFAFDPNREAIILCGGDKDGVSKAKFYKALIGKADKRFDEWLESED